jgi:GPH family glycoside/pentoside/hexuronide:cation symporter
MSRQFGKGQKWSFSMGNFATWFINSAFNLWVFSFYYAAVKLPIQYIMTAYLIWTFWNAVNDPILGYISDRIHTRWGRRKPFAMIGLIPVLILEIIIWTPPTGSYYLQFIYLLIMLLVYDTTYSMITIPVDSLFPELYTSVEERAEVNTIRQILAAVGLIFSALVPGIFIGEIDQIDGYLLNGIVTTIIVAVSMVIFIKWGALEKEEFKMDHKQDFGFFRGLGHAFSNLGFIMYILMFFFYEYVLLLLATVVPLFGEHVIGTTSSFETSILMGLLYIVSIISIFIWKIVDVKLGGRTGYMISIVCYIVGTIPWLWVDSYLMALIVIVFMGFGFGGMLYFIWLLISDVVDQDELKTGVRREGVFFGFSYFFMRLSMIASILTVGVVFTQTGWGVYDPNPGIDKIIGLKFIFVVVPWIVLGISLGCLYVYPLTKSKVEEIKQKLAELHKEKMERVKSA